MKMRSESEKRDILERIAKARRAGISCEDAIRAEKIQTSQYYEWRKKLSSKGVSPRKRTAVLTLPVADALTVTDSVVLIKCSTSQLKQVLEVLQ